MNLTGLLKLLSDYSLIAYEYVAIEARTRVEEEESVRGLLLIYEEIVIRQCRQERDPENLPDVCARFPHMYPQYLAWLKLLVEERIIAIAGEQ
jgi:hypothetical protein